MKMIVPLALLAALALSACSRPAEVLTLAASAHPIGVSLKRSSEALQARFAEQRTTRETRAAELTQQAARARSYLAGIEREWRFADKKDQARRLGILREEDEAILANPFAPLLAPEAVSSKPPKLDQGPIDVVIKNFALLEKERQPNALEVASFFAAVNEELKKIDDEQAGTASPAP